MTALYLRQPRDHRGRVGGVDPVLRFNGHCSPEPNSGCWLWMGGVAGRGYGVFRVEGRQVFAHRFSWELANDRKLRPGEVVCHRCDVPGCVNPAHLFAADQAANMADMVKKRRGTCKLSDLQVRAIFTDARSRRRISRDFGISWNMVRLIKERRSWRHLTENL